MENIKICKGFLQQVFFIGKFELPESEMEQEEQPARTSKKKLRRDMTEEELQRARDLDHKRYAQKVAAKKRQRKRNGRPFCKAQHTNYRHRKARLTKSQAEPQPQKSIHLSYPLPNRPKAERQSGGFMVILNSFADVGGIEQ